MNNFILNFMNLIRLICNSKNFNVLNIYEKYEAIIQTIFFQTLSLFLL